MRRLILKLTLMCIILLNISLVVKAQSMDQHFHKMLYALSSIPSTNMVFINLAVIMMILFMFSTLLFRNIIKLKAKTEEINNLIELRKTFIDSDRRLIYLKDNNLKYIFVNKALEDFYNLESSEIVGYDDFHLTDKEFAKMRRKTDIDVLKKNIVLDAEVKWHGRIYKTIKFPIKLLNGKPGVGAYIEDVTEATNNKRKEEKTLLRNSILVNVFNHNFSCENHQHNYVLSKALELTESKSGYICLYDEESQEVTLNTWSEDVMDESETEHKKTKYQLNSTGLWGESIRQKRPIVVNDLEMPNTMKKGYPHSNVKLSKFMSVPVIINDKIVAVVGLANKEEDYDDNDVYQLTVLMTGVWNDIERRKGEIELEKTNIILKESKDKLQLILDSAAEAIYGIDNSGNCTFCNASCLKILIVI